METLNELSGTLPTIQSQVSDIRVVYDSGRQKVGSSLQVAAYSSINLSSRCSGPNTYL